MKKGLFHVLMFCATFLLTAQLSAQSFPSVSPAPSTTYSSLQALPADYTLGLFSYSFSYNPDGSVLVTRTTTASGVSSQITVPSGGSFPTPVGPIFVNSPELPSGYTYTSTGQILTPNGQTVSSFTSGGPEVPFDGGMSLMLLASGIGYGAKRLKAKKAANATE